MKQNADRLFVARLIKSELVDNPLDVHADNVTKSLCVREYQSGQDEGFPFAPIHPVTSYLTNVRCSTMTDGLAVNE